MEDLVEAVKFKKRDEALKIADKLILNHAIDLIKYKKLFYLQHLVTDRLFLPTDNNLLNYAIDDLANAERLPNKTTSCLPIYKYLATFIHPNSDNLFHAVKEGKIEIVKFLGDIMDLAIQDSKAFRLAALYGHLDILKFLKPISDVTAYHNQALKWAVEGEHVKVVKFLLTIPETHTGIADARKRTKNKKILKHLCDRIICNAAKPLESRNPYII